MSEMWHGLVWVRLIVVVDVTWCEVRACVWLAFRCVFTVVAWSCCNSLLSLLAAAAGQLVGVARLMCVCG